MISLEIDGFKFEFENVIDAYVFDEKDKNKPTFHGAPMKAVDVMVELEDRYIYIELKERSPESSSEVECESIDENSRANWLKNRLVCQFRDSYLYRHAEDKIDKPIDYICLLVNYKPSICNRIAKGLRIELPVGDQIPSVEGVPKRWKRSIASSCRVLNLDAWNERFPRWQVSRVA